MEVKVENIRAIDMLKARVKNRVARSKCFKNASLILIGITALSIALNIYLIINYTIQKTASESEHYTSSPPTESNKETSTIPIDNPDINPNSQLPTQQSTESLTLNSVASVSPSETEPASTSDTTNHLSSANRSTTQPSESRTKTKSTVHKRNIPSAVSRTQSPSRATTKAVLRATTLRTSSTGRRPTTTSVQSDSSITAQNYEETSSANPQASASAMQK
uniref:Attachment glycoprotein n=1 Tax=human metapneumovirus TaxID=162145 RepID=A0A1V1FG93_9MONO|nr:attachment glycoprotein [Human metapneumovirus]